MNKKVFVLLAFALLCMNVNAETIKEETFSSMGYGEDLVLSEGNKEKCEEILFYNEFNNEEFTIISVHLNLFLTQEGTQTSKLT